MIKIVQFLNNSSLLVAFAAAAICAEFQILSLGAVNPVYTMLAFSSTWLAYTFLKTNHTYDTIFWKRASATLFVLNLFFIDRISLLFLFSAGIIVLLYSSQLLIGTTYRFPFELRKHPVLKTTSIATCWIVITAIVPYQALSLQHFIAARDSVLLIFSLWCLIAALSISGDARDATIDNDQFISWPSWVGIRGTKVLMIVLLLLSVVSLFAIDNMMESPVYWPIILYSIVAGVSLLIIRPDKNWHIQTSWIDGLLIIHFILIYFAVSV